MTINLRTYIIKLHGLNKKISKVRLNKMDHEIISIKKEKRKKYIIFIKSLDGKIVLLVINIKK